MWDLSKCCCPRGSSQFYALVRQIDSAYGKYAWNYDTATSFAANMVCGDSSGNVYFVIGGYIIKTNKHGVELWRKLQSVFYMTCDDDKIYFSTGVPGLNSGIQADLLFGSTPTLHAISTGDGSNIWAVPTHSTAVKILVSGSTLHCGCVNKFWGDSFHDGAWDEGRYTVFANFSAGDGSQMGNDVPAYENGGCYWSDGTDLYIGGNFGSFISGSTHFGASMGIGWQDNIPATSGYYILNYDGVDSDPIFFWQGHQDIENILNSMPNIAGSANVLPLGGGPKVISTGYFPCSLTFMGTAFYNLSTTPLLTVDNSNLVGGSVAIFPQADSSPTRYHLKKLGSDGSLTWKYSHGAGILDVIGGGNIYFCGAPGDGGATIRKLDSGAGVIWSDAFADQLNSISLDPGGNVASGGVTADGSANLGYWTSGGSRIWTFPHNNTITKIQAKTSEKIYLSGYRGKA